MQDTSSAVTTMIASIGDQLGLFKDLAARGPATSDQLAARMMLHERYVREWLAAMAAAAYLAYDPRARSFALPAEHTPALTEEGGPFFFGGVHEMIADMIERLPQIRRAFRDRGGVPQSAYGDSTWECPASRTPGSRICSCRRGFLRCRT